MSCWRTAAKAASRLADDYCELGAVLGMNGVRVGAPEPRRLDVGDRRPSRCGRRLPAVCAVAFRLRHGLPPTALTVLGRVGVSTVRMWMRRATDCGCGRSRSTFNRPLSRGRALDLDPVGQDERALEPSRRDPAVQVHVAVLARILVAAPARDHQLVVFDDDLQVVGAEAGDGHGDAEPAVAPLLDVVGRVAVARRLRHTISASARSVRSRAGTGSRTGSWHPPPRASGGRTLSGARPPQSGMWREGGAGSSPRGLVAQDPAESTAAARAPRHVRPRRTPAGRAPPRRRGARPLRACRRGGRGCRCPSRKPCGRPHTWGTGHR